MDGVHYHFVDEASFQALIDRSAFLEHASVFDYRYGTSREAVEQQLKTGFDVILDIDWQGARQIRNSFPSSCSIFIVPLSLESLRQRLIGRGQDSDSVIQRRMRDAQAEISHWAEFDQLVVNDDFNMALEELLAIINDHRIDKPHQVNKDYQHLAQRLGKS